MTNPVRFEIQPGGCLTGRLRVPGDKSISHRALMLGAIAEGITEIGGFLEGEDCLATLAVLRAMGVRIDGPEEGHVDVYGAGLHGLKAPSGPLDFGNSGTSMRLLAGLLCGQSFDTLLTGDSSLRRRPMRRIADPLRMMGAMIETGERGTPPLTIKGGRRLHGIDHAMDVASAQVKSALLLAGLYAEGETCIVEPAPTRDHTERMLIGMGYPVRREGGSVRIRGGGRLKGGRVDVPGDLSSAAFFMVGAAIAENSDLLLETVGINSTRTGVIDILRLMGADIELSNECFLGGEPTADIRVRASRLSGIEILPETVPLAIDEFPAIFIAAACAVGKTILRGAGELRVKESDRIQVMAEGLHALGIAAEPTPDGIMIEGGTLRGGRVDARGDHRVAMAFAMAALRASGSITIDDCENVMTSFPNFPNFARRAGLGIANGE